MGSPKRVTRDADTLIRETIGDIAEWLGWGYSDLERRAFIRGQQLSRTQWANYLTGKAKLTDNIARAIAAVFSLPDPDEYDAEALRDTLDSSWEQILDVVLHSMVVELSEILREKRADRD